MERDVKEQGILSVHIYSNLTTQVAEKSLFLACSHTFFLRIRAKRLLPNAAECCHVTQKYPHTQAFSACSQ